MKYKSFQNIESVYLYILSLSVDKFESSFMNFSYIKNILIVTGGGKIIGMKYLS